MVIVSIIMGLGITALLRGLVDAFRADRTWTPGLLHSLWVANLLVLHIGVWSLRWSGARRTDWPFGVLLAYLLLPILLYALAELLFPKSAEGRLSDYFLANRRVFFTVLGMAWLVAFVGPFVFVGNPFGGGRLWAGAISPLLMAAASPVFAVSSNRRLHVVWAIATMFIQLQNLGLIRVG